jgi:hypothetical protein
METCDETRYVSSSVVTTKMYSESNVKAIAVSSFVAVFDMQLSAGEWRSSARGIRVELASYRGSIETVHRHTSGL